MPAFLFDLDGVIIHSMPLHAQAWEIYLRKHGIDPGDLQAAMHGRRNDAIVTAYWGDQISADDNFRYGAEKEALFREMMTPVFEEYVIPGAREFVRSLAGPKGLGSNAERANIEFTLERAGLSDAFDAIMDGNQVEHPKPYPDIYLALAERLQRTPKDCIVFEDSTTGVAAARAAGMRVVGVDSSRTGLENVDLLVHDFQDMRLGPWLQGQE